MSKREVENDKIEKSTKRFRKYSDKKLLELHNGLGFHCPNEIKQAYNLVLKERGLK